MTGRETAQPKADKRGNVWLLEGRHRSGDEPAIRLGPVYASETTALLAKARFERDLHLSYEVNLIRERIVT